MNIREELNKLDQDTFNQYDLFNLYSSVSVDKELKEQVVGLIKESKCEELCKLLSEAYEKQTGISLHEEAYDNLPEIEDKVKGVTDQVTAKAVKDHEKKMKNIRKGLKDADAEIKDEPFTSGENQPKPEEPIVPDLIKEDLDEEKFHVVIQYKHPEKVLGKNGVELKDIWSSLDWFNCDSKEETCNELKDIYNDDYYKDCRVIVSGHGWSCDGKEFLDHYCSSVDESLKEDKMSAEDAKPMGYEAAKEYCKSKGLNLDRKTYNMILRIAGKKEPKNESLKESGTVDTGHYDLWDEKPYTKKQLLYDLNSDKMLEKAKGSFQVGHPDERDLCAEILSDAGYEYEISGDGPWFHFEYWKNTDESLNESEDEENTYSAEEYDRVYNIVCDVAIETGNFPIDQLEEDITERILSDNGEGLSEEEIRELTLEFFEDELVDIDESLGESVDQDTIAKLKNYTTKARALDEQRVALLKELFAFKTKDLYKLSDEAETEEEYNKIETMVVDFIDARRDLNSSLTNFDKYIAYESLEESVEDDYEKAKAALSSLGLDLPKDIYNIILNRNDKKSDMEMPQKESLKEDYGWEIPVDKVWDVYDELVEIMGAEGLLLSLAKAMGTEELADNLAYICRMNDLEISSLEDSPERNESLKESEDELKDIPENPTLKQFREWNWDSEDTKRNTQLMKNAIEKGDPKVRQEALHTLIDAIVEGFPEKGDPWANAYWGVVFEVLTQAKECGVLSEVLEEVKNILEVDIFDKTPSNAVNPETGEILSNYLKAYYLSKGRSVPQRLQGINEDLPYVPGDEDATIILSDIEWDLDGEDKQPDLPKDLEIDFHEVYEDGNDYLFDDEFDKLQKYLEEIYGFAIKDFYIEIKKK